MRRREFVEMLSGAAAGSLLLRPLVSRAQQPTMPVIGFLNSASPERFGNLVAGFNRGLAEAGFVDGRNVTIEYRWAEGHYDRLGPLVADLVQRRVTAIAATGSPNAAQVAKTAAAKIPIVFANGGDPVSDGLVASLARPAGNVTGVTFFTNVLAAKRLGLLLELSPTAAVVAALINPSNSRAESDTRNIEEAARAIGRKVVVLYAGNDQEIEAAFATLARERVGALSVNADGFFRTRMQRLVALAAQHAVPAAYSDRDATLAGGLISYGTSISDGYRWAGVYVGRILKGAVPSELPVLQPTKFELTINLKTAKALGLTVPNTLLVSADEVLE